MSGTYDNTASIPPPTVASTAFSAAASPSGTWDVLSLAIEAAFKDPAERARVIAALEAIGGQSKWARRVKGTALVLAGILVVLKGSSLLDGASLAVGGALATAGAAELAGGL